MKKILFRADANPSIGAGDLMSLVHMSRHFENSGWETHFIIRAYDAGLSIAEKHSLGNLLAIDAGISVPHEVDAINNYISANDIDVLFMEITERPLTEYKGLTDSALRACVCFDGLITGDFSLVVNWDVDAARLFDPSKYSGTTFLLGPEYVVLPVTFDYEQIKNRIYRITPQKLLIAMGGADELNFTQKIVDILIQNRTHFELNVIIGPGYGHKKGLLSTLRSSSLRYAIHENTTNMFPEYMQCDRAVGAGGLTAYELVATRTPAVLIATYEHQIARCSYFQEKGLVKYLGYRNHDANSLIKSLDEPFSVPDICFAGTPMIKETIDELLAGH